MVAQDGLRAVGCRQRSDHFSLTVETVDVIVLCRAEHVAFVVADDGYVFYTRVVFIVKRHIFFDHSAYGLLHGSEIITDFNDLSFLHRAAYDDSDLFLFSYFILVFCHILFLP